MIKYWPVCASHRLNQCDFKSPSVALLADLELLICAMVAINVISLSERFGRYNLKLQVALLDE